MIFSSFSVDEYTALSVNTNYGYVLSLNEITSTNVFRIWRNRDRGFDIPISAETIQFINVNSWVEGESCIICWKKIYARFKKGIDRKRTDFNLCTHELQRLKYIQFLKHSMALEE